jgi:hypothetical protein
MRARLFGHWVGRAAIFAALGFGALVAGGVASASAYVEHQQVDSIGSSVSGAVSEGVIVSFGYEWN